MTLVVKLSYANQRNGWSQMTVALCDPKKRCLLLSASNLYKHMLSIAVYASTKRPKRSSLKHFQI